MNGGYTPARSWQAYRTCAEAGTAVGAGRPHACGPKRATSVAQAGNYP